MPPVTRLAPVKLAGTQGTCTGSTYPDFNTWMRENPSKAPSTGDQLRMRFWYRDPASTRNQTTSLCDGLAFSICP